MCVEAFSINIWLEGFREGMGRRCYCTYVKFFSPITTNLITFTGLNSAVAQCCNEALGNGNKIRTFISNFMKTRTLDYIVSFVATVYSYIFFKVTDLVRTLGCCLFFKL